MRRTVHGLGLRGGGQSPLSFAPTFAPSFKPTKSVFGGGAGQKLASFLRFDGTSTFVEWSAGPSSVSDGRRGTFVVPFNRKGGSGAECILYVGATTGESVFIGFDSSNHLVARLSDGAVSPAAILTLTSTSTYSDSVNRVAVFSYDLDTIGSSAFYWLYVNDADETGTPSTGTPADIDLTDTWRIGSTDDSGDRQWYSGATGHILFYPEVFPLPDANTRKYLYDAAADGPVDHGADGADALGDHPPLYWVPTAADALNNLGDGGDADSGTSFSDAADPPNLAPLPAFAANAVAFDDTGSSVTGDYIDYTSGLPGADQALMLWKISFRRTRTSHAETIWNISSSARSRIWFPTNDTVRIHIIGQAGAQRWLGALDGVTITDTNWHTLLVSMDANDFTVGGKLSIRLDGVSQLLDSAPNGDGTVDLNLSPWSLGRETGSSVIFDGDIAEFQNYVPSSYIDLDSDAEAAKYFASGKPVFQGLTGMKSTGVRPLQNFRTSAALTSLNSGSVGHGAVTGTLADASSSPTD